MLPTSNCVMALGFDRIKQDLKIESQQNLPIIKLPGMEYVYKLASTAALQLLVRCDTVSSWQILQLKALCAAFTSRLDSKSTDYLDMKPSVLGEALLG